ncbi:protein of unknown function [Streptantibioticus cattleyicolor NRRL 8057 = DSM 46488]|nr:protein of unknown function [Streptantibioticus cattleyicolor NRRL 8057 = DSM 46488]
MLRCFASEVYDSGSIVPTDAVMNATRAREGRTPPWRCIPDPITVYRPGIRKRVWRAVSDPSRE